MPLFTKHGKTILFTHIPKTGGSSVTLFFQRNGFAVDWFRSGWFDASKRESSPQHRHREAIVAALRRDAVACEYSFAIVRDPLDRLVSEYFHQCRSLDALSRQLTADGFASWVERVFAMNEENPVLFDNHIRPQLDFLLDDTEIFRFENGFRDLARFLHVGEPRYRFGFDFADFPHWLKGHNRQAVDVRRATRDRIFRFYERDYARFYPGGGPSPAGCP